MRTAQATQAQAIFNKAKNALYTTTGIQLETERREPKVGGARFDAFARLVAHGQDIPLAVEIKARPTKAIIGGMVQQLKGIPGKGLLVADYINPNMAEQLKELDVWFVDAAGNAFINQPPIYVDIKGNRPIENTEQQQKIRAFQTTGLKIIFTFLCQRALVNAPYRDIAQAAGVALGTVGGIIADLKELGYLVDTKKQGRYLIQIKALLDRWVIAYPEQLRPKLVIGTYTTDTPDWWKSTNLQKQQAYLGGEIAAEHLTHYLQAYKKTIYLRGPATKLEVAAKLQKDPNGEVELLNAFWNEELDEHDRKTVHPILVYADLLATGDPRNMETAERIYEQDIAEYIRED